MNYTLITGACGGLGNAFAKECAKNKENLLLIGTKQTKLDELVEKFKEYFEEIDIKTFVCNLANDDEREQILVFIHKNKMCINKLINNAGVIIEGDLERFSDSEIENAIKVNCIGTLDLTKKILEVRDKTQKLEVLTVASVAGFVSIPHMSVYSATKAFLVSIMTSLAFEYKKQNVVFTTVCPGGMATTKEMQESIKSMGLGGKLSTLSTEKVAKRSLKALSKKKTLVSIGFFNKVMAGSSKLASRAFVARSTGKIWAKSQAKRNF